MAVYEVCSASVLTGGVFLLNENVAFINSTRSLQAIAIMQPPLRYKRKVAGRK